MSSRPLHYLMHIPKTAGMSLQALVRRRYKPEERLLIYRQQQLENGFADKEELQLVMGHFRFGYHRFSSRPFSYSVFLRDPVDQLISHYRYTQDHPEKFEYLPSGIRDIEDFARCPYGDNLQTRFIAGRDVADAQSLQTAKVNLLKHFEVIGLSEAFDASLLLLADQLGWQIKYYTRENTGRARLKSKGPESAQRQRLREILKYDIELYAFAQMLFRNQLDKNPGLKARLRVFRWGNRIFQWGNPTYVRLKQLFGLVKEEKD